MNMKDASGLEFAFPTAIAARRIRQRKRPVQERSQATVDAVLEATLQVLKKDGYLALTTTQVAKRAGVSVGTLYQYFPDKASLVVALKVSYFEQMVTAVQSAAREVPAEKSKFSENPRGRNCHAARVFLGVSTAPCAWRAPPNLHRK